MRPCYPQTLPFELETMIFTETEIKHILAALGLYFHSLKLKHGHHDPIMDEHRRVVRKLVAELNEQPVDSNSANESLTCMATC